MKLNLFCNRIVKFKDEYGPPTTNKLCTEML